MHSQICHIYICEIICTWGLRSEISPMMFQTYWSALKLDSVANMKSMNICFLVIESKCTCKSNNLSKPSKQHNFMYIELFLACNTLRLPYQFHTESKAINSILRVQKIWLVAAMEAARQMDGNFCTCTCLYLINQF